MAQETARLGKDGKPSTPVEVDEWEVTPEGSSDEFIGETGGFWRDMGFVRNATFVRIILSLYCPGMFYIIFDNINIFLRKFQQRLFNKNSMIHATNVAIISLPNADLSAADLDAKKEHRGKRAEAKSSDLLPTAEDEEKSSGRAGTEMLKAAEAFITADRPLPPKKTDGRPAGLFDELSGLGEEEWATKARIIVGDLLTSNNIRGARKDRMDDINGMEHLEYVEEQSTLWHFALNATHMIMRLHFGDSALDPGSLAKHKGLLNRTWDAEKPNYADAKALIHHSLVSSCTKSYLAKWKPTVTGLSDFAQDFVAEFTITSNVEMSKSVNDDYRAHSQLFIRDAMIFCVFEHAVAFADAGVVLRALTYWHSRSVVLVCIITPGNVSRSWSSGNTSSHRPCERPRNRLGSSIDGVSEERNIASDLYLEQNNFWVKVFYGVHLFEQHF
ncbi:hypothetical protein DFH09DRAFT_1088897 [Mycena vulgaris]|nr:hypothetical protein DFH09DRAFT_1088897 [Mycena vulgaris]